MTQARFEDFERKAELLPLPSITNSDDTLAFTIPGEIVYPSTERFTLKLEDLLCTCNVPDSHCKEVDVRYEI